MGEAWSNQLVSLLILSLPGGFTGIFGYSPAPGPGNLVISITNQAGTDPYGNPYPAGIQVGAASSPQVEITPGNPAAITFPLNDSNIGGQPTMASSIIPGPPKYAQLAIQGPSYNLGQHRDFYELDFFTATSDGAISSEVVLSQWDGVSAYTTMAYCDVSGVKLICTSGLSATIPGTGTSNTNKAQSEVWHVLPLDAGWTVQPGYPQPQYRYLATGDLQLSGVAFANFTSAAGKQLNSSNPLPVGYRPLRSHDWRTGDLIGSRCHVSIGTAGIIGGNPPTGATFPANYYCDIEGIVALQTT